MNKKIGILALQGDVLEHMEHFERLRVPCKPVKDEKDFENINGLIIPGGESTCLFRLMKIFKLDTVIKEYVDKGMKVWGTCAGAILVADQVVNEEAKLSLVAMKVQRNAFGSQLESFNTKAKIPKLGNDDFPLTFIRAPKILEVSDDVEVLLKLNDFIAMIETDNVMATVFHPELTPCLAFHRYFAEKCGIEPTVEQGHDFDKNWKMTSWTKFAQVK